MFAQTLDTAEWVVRSASNLDDATVLRPAEEELWENWDASYFELHCEGNPASFSLEVQPALETAPWSVDFDGGLPGTVRIGRTPAWSVEWRSYGRVGIETPLSRGGVEALMASAGSLEIQVDVSGAETFHREFSASEPFVSAIAEFLEACDHHVRQTDRQFKVDGIEVMLKVEVDAQDIEDMRRLAAAFGIDDIERIYVGLIGRPVSSLGAEVRGREVWSDDRFSRRSLDLTNQHWRRSWANPEEDAVSQGAWRTSRKYLHEDTRWILRGGAWSIEVRVGPDVSYEVTARIIGAIRQGSLVDAREKQAYGTYPAMPSPADLGMVGPESLPRITRARGEDGNAAESTVELYNVYLPISFGSAKSLTVRMVDDQVEVVNIAISMI